MVFFQSGWITSGFVFAQKEDLCIAPAFNQYKNCIDSSDYISTEQYSHSPEQFCPEATFPVPDPADEK